MISSDLHIDLEELTASSYQKRLLKKNVSDYVDWLVIQNKITAKEQASLQAMINSPDDENCVLAVAIIELKKPNQDGNTIYSRES